MSPQFKQRQIAATSSQTQQLCPFLRRRSASTSAAMAKSVGKPSAMSSKLLLPRSSGSTMAQWQRGPFASACDFSQDSRQWRHKRCPHGSSLGSVNCSRHTLRSSSLGSTGTEAVAIANVDFTHCYVICNEQQSYTMRYEICLTRTTRAFCCKM